MLIEVKVEKGSKHVTIDPNKVAHITNSADGTAEIRAYAIGERDYVTFQISSTEANRIVGAIHLYEISNKKRRSDTITLSDFLKIDVDN